MLRFLLGLALFCFCLPVIAPILSVLLTGLLFVGQGCPDAYHRRSAQHEGSR